MHERRLSKVVRGCAGVHALKVYEFLYLCICRSVASCYDYIQACTLHMLDIDWQLYDLAFLVDIKLPELYMELAKGKHYTVPTKLFYI